MTEPHVWTLPAAEPGPTPDLSPAAQPGPTPDLLPAFVPTFACSWCGRTPAEAVTFHQVRGAIVTIGIAARGGTLCRDCGLAVFREVQGRNLVLGWWSVPALVVTPFLLVRNALRARRLHPLAEPADPPSGPTGLRPQDPGRPLWRRWAAAGALIPIAFIAIGINLRPADPADDWIGRCVHADPEPGYVQIVDCGDRYDGFVTAAARTPEECPKGTTGWFSEIEETTWYDPDHPRSYAALEDGRVLCYSLR